MDNKDNNKNLWAWVMYDFANSLGNITLSFYYSCRRPRLQPWRNATMAILWAIISTWKLDTRVMASIEPNTM